ncbi:MAG: hypothetical protein KAJ18_08660 [Candidatus Omnitrophica bacterium]|nr:hypothetical protein [Candidatus Omnitrophota bacterium]
MKNEKKKNGKPKAQLEMSITDTPLFNACQEMTASRDGLGIAKKRMEEAQVVWCKEMRVIQKSKINHDGVIIQLITGKTSEDHATFRRV